MFIKNVSLHLQKTIIIKSTKNKIAKIKNFEFFIYPKFLFIFLFYKFLSLSTACL